MQAEYLYNPAMPTSPSTRRKRFIAAGHFDEARGYVVDRPAGCHDWLLIYSVRGSGMFSYQGGAFSTQAHGAVLIAPDTPHRYEVAASTTRWELLWAHFLPPAEWRAWLKWQSPAPGWGHVQVKQQAVRKQIVTRFAEAVRLTAGYRHHREALALNALEAVLLGCHEQVAMERGQGLDPRIGDILDFVCRQLDRPLSIQDLAKECHLSPSRFAHLFSEQMQMTPLQFIEQQRIERARELLEHTGYTISAIARQVGFESPFYFSRRFKQAEGMSPREYRRQANPYWKLERVRHKFAATISDAAR
jgi:AraC family transcriptional regulator of arabinose operon